MACLQAGRFCSAKLASTCRHSGSWLPQNSWLDPTPKLMWSRRLDQQTYAYDTMELVVCFEWVISSCGKVGHWETTIRTNSQGVENICQVTDR